MQKQGFTLIEFVIYIAIVSMVSILITGFLWDIILGNIKETSYQEVQQNGRFGLTKITQEIKKATAINNPIPGESASILSLSMADPSLDPTIFDLANGNLRITHGIAQPYELTSDQVIVGDLQFTNLSYPDTPGTIRIEMMVNHINPGHRIEYQTLIDLKSTVSLMPSGEAP